MGEVLNWWIGDAGVAENNNPFFPRFSIFFGGII
jgi:hypothetical protein